MRSVRATVVGVGKQCAILSSVVWPTLKICFNVSHKGHDFRKKQVTKDNMRVLISSRNFVWNTSRCKKKLWSFDFKKNVYWTWILLRFYKNYVYQQIFEKYTNVRLHTNASSGTRVPCGPTNGRVEIVRQTDITKLIVDFHNIFKCA